MLVDGGQLPQVRVSSRRSRLAVSVLRPAGVSTVTATTGQPAASARLTSIFVTWNWLVV
jgi:hypothetical protein